MKKSKNKTKQLNEKSEISSLLTFLKISKIK